MNDFMNDNEGVAFLRFLGAVLLTLIVLAICLGAAHAQNAGTVGIYTREVQVFNAQAANASCGVYQNGACSAPVFPDFGFGCNFLSIQNSSFTGTIDVEWSPTGSAPFFPLAFATYGIDSGYHTLQVGGYYPNMRSTLTWSHGSLSAWYSAQSGPCPVFGSGLSTNGQTSPVLCQANMVISVATGTTALLAAPVNTGDTLVICGFTISFQAAPSSGTVQLIAAPSNACTSFATGPWESYTSTNSDLDLIVPIQQFFAAGSYACLINSSGVTALVSFGYASVHGL